MLTRIPRIPLFCLTAFLALWLGSCQTTDPPPADTVLWVKLNDTLSRYDLVVVQLLDAETKAVIKTLWSERLPDPQKNIPGYTLGSLANKSFVVKISGYKSLGQLALETLITYEGGGKKSVSHTDLPPLRPINGLLGIVPSAGKITPAFARDTLNYKVTLPSGVTSLSFALQAESPNANISFEGETVVSGGSTIPINIGDTPDTVKVLVTDISTGSAVTRIYTLVLFPTLPPGLFLTSIKPSYGSLYPDFNSDTQIYTLYIPKAIDTVSFFLTPADPQTMTMVIDHKAIFPGAKSQLFHIDPTSVYPIPMELHRGAAMSFYQVTVTHDSTSSTH